MDIHLCLVTGQPLANLIPILQYRPERVALVVSDQMKIMADRFVQTLKSLGWREDSVDIFEGLASNRYDAMQQCAMEVFEALESRYPQARVVYNATGGNKLMALAFSQWFGGKDQNDIIYVDTTNHHIEWISVGREKVEHMSSVLNLEIYLKAQGKTLRSRQEQNEAWQQLAFQRKPATRYLAEHASRLGGLVALFNRTYAPDNKLNGAPEILRLEQPLRKEWRAALSMLAEGGVLAMGDNDREWYPASRDAAVYLSGAWLEEYVYFAVKDVGVEEAALSVTFTDDSDRKSDIRNELDVAVVHNNQLLVIECKTGNTTRDQKDQEIIYKLDSLSGQAGGALGFGALISFRPLEHKNRNGRSVNARARASSVKLFTCEADELSGLRARIRNWMECGQWVEPT